MTESKSLVERLAGEADPEHFYPDKALYADELKFLAKFAELVARECINLCEAATGSSEECRDGERRYFEATPDDCAAAIRQRFGVGE